jgi:uncharacterized protein YecE (DUF72 family)
LHLYVGCSGFSYSSWVGPFYPKGTPQNKYLAHYATVFDYVEIDSSFYRIPNSLTAAKWAKNTPDNFRFTVKMTQAVTHKKRLGAESEIDLHHFYAAMLPLKDKLLAVLLQLPPSITKNEGIKKLKALPLDDRFRHAVEARHASWFHDEVYECLKENNLCLAWSQLDELQTPPIVTTDFIYLRFIGDRSIPESEFGRIQKNRESEMQYWADEIEKLPRSKIKQVIAPANNHYAGFGPGTATLFMKMLGMSQEERQESRTSQKSLFDYSGS